MPRLIIGWTVREFPGITPKHRTYESRAKKLAVNRPEREYPTKEISSDVAEVYCMKIPELSDRERPRSQGLTMNLGTVFLAREGRI